MSRIRQEMRRPLVSQAEEVQGKVNNSLYLAKTMITSILHLHQAPFFSQPQ